MIRVSSSAFILSQEGDLGRMFFMNYSGLENTSSKMLKYATDLKQVQGTMYASTKEKLENSIKNCEESLEIMKEFLEQHKDDNTKNGDSRRVSMRDYEEMDKRYVTKEEFNELKDKVDGLDKKVDDVLDKLGQLLQKSVSVVSDAVDTVKCAVVPDPYDPKNATNNSTKPYLNLPENATKSEKKKKDKSIRKLMRQNHELLSKFPEEVRQNCNYHEFIECSDLISHWFNMRFEPSRYPKNGFNAEFILKYSEQIIGAYAYYWSQGETKLSEFVTGFKQWCDELAVSGKNVSYLYPYSVGKIQYNAEWIETDSVACANDYRWATLATFLSDGFRLVSKSYSRFVDSYYDINHSDNLLDIFFDKLGIDDELFIRAINKGSVDCMRDKFERVSPTYCTLESGESFDVDRYNMLDKEIVFA